MRRWLMMALLICGGVGVYAGLALDAAEASESSIMLSERPDPEGTPTVVEIRAFVVDVFRISSVLQEFEADCLFVFTWRDSRLADAGTRTLPLAEVWKPNIAIVNDRDLDSRLPEVVTVDPQGVVTYVQRLIGSFSARMNLHEFPFDWQILPFVFSTYSQSLDEVVLQPYSDRTEGFGDFSVADWRLTLGAPDTSPLVNPTTGHQASRVTFQIRAERNVGYYGWMVYAPLIFIVFMAWMVFWIDPSLIPSQIGLSTASVFSLIAFRFSIRSMLPAVSYMTRMDMFVFGCTVLVFLALAHAVFTGRLSKQGRDDLALSMDRWGRWIYVAALVALGIVYI